LQHLVNVFFGEAGQKGTFTVQQGEYNSREIICALWQRMPGGGQLPMRTDDITVMVVFKHGTVTTPPYATTIIGDNEISFVLPQSVMAAAGKAEMQLNVYGDDSLLNSAIVPFKILASITPATVGQPDVEPGLLGILQQVRTVLNRAERAEKAREEAERDRAKTFEEWKKIIEDLGEGTASVFNAETRYDFPSVGSPNVIYKAESERKIYQWNSDELKYEALNSAETTEELNIKVIYGGDASGTVGN